MAVSNESTRWFDRRGLMRCGAGAGLAMAAGSSGLALPLEVWGKDPARKMKLSCSSINFSSLPIEEAVERIAELGFDAIDIWSAHAGCPHLDDALDRLGAEGLNALLLKNGLELYSFSVYKGGYAKYAELLGQCGGGVAVQGSMKLSDPKNLKAEMKAYLESLAPLLKLAEKHNSYLAIENHGNALLHSRESFEAFVELNDHPRLGIALAPYHVQSWDGDLVDVIEICGEQLLFFYAWQKGQETEQLPGIGPMDFKGAMEALGRVGFEYPVNPFMHHEPEPGAMEAALVKSMRYLRSIGV